MENNHNNGNEEPKTKIKIIPIGLSIVGAILSLYSLGVHLKIKQGGTNPYCDVNDLFNCTSVIGSAYGEFFSIPLGAYGLAYFFVVIAAAILVRFTAVSLSWIARVHLLLSGVGLLTCLILFAISYFKLHALCPSCLSVYGVVFIYFVWSVREFFQTRPLPVTSSPQSLMQLIVMGASFATPALLAGLVLPVIVTQFFSDTGVKQETASELNNNSATEYQTAETVNPVIDEAKLKFLNAKEKIKTFNKSNFVGLGQDFRKGNDNAPVVVQIFSDFGCHHCKDSFKPLMDAQRVFGENNVVVVYRFFPLDANCNPTVQVKDWYPHTCVLSLATRCAGQQGKLWEFKDWAYSGQEWSQDKRNTEFSMDGLKKKAASLKINVSEFEKCVETKAELPKIQEDCQLAKDLNIKGTPFILINGEHYEGPLETDSFVAQFQRALLSQVK